MVVKKVMAGFIGVLIIACLGQFLFLCHLRNEERSSSIAESSVAPAIATIEPDKAWKQTNSDLPVSTWTVVPGAQDRHKADFKEEPSTSPSAPLLSLGSAPDKSANASGLSNEVPGPLASRGAQHSEPTPPLDNPTLPALGAPIALLQPLPEKPTNPTPTAPNHTAGSAALGHSNNLGLETQEPPKLPVPIPTAIPFPANSTGNVTGDSKEPAPNPSKGSLAEPPMLGLEPFPPVKKEDPVAALAQVHKELAQLMSPEELRQAVVAATAQLEERKKRKEKERKEQAALTALEKVRSALKQVSFEFPDTDAGKKASEFLKTLENKESQTFPGLSPPKPGALDSSSFPPVSFQEISREKKAAIKVTSAGAVPR